MSSSALQTPASHSAGAPLGHGPCTPLAEEGQLRRVFQGLMGKDTSQISLCDAHTHWVDDWEPPAATPSDRWMAMTTDGSEESTPWIEEDTSTSGSDEGTTVHHCCHDQVALECSQQIVFQ